MALTRTRFRPSGNTGAKQGWSKQSTGTQAEETKKASETTEELLDKHDQTAAVTGSEVGQEAPSTATNIHSKEKSIESNSSELIGGKGATNNPTNFILSSTATIKEALFHVYGKASSVNACEITVSFLRAEKTVQLVGKLNSTTTKWFSFSFALTAEQKATLKEILEGELYEVDFKAAQTVKETGAQISTVFKWYAELEWEPGASTPPLVMLI